MTQPKFTVEQSLEMIHSQLYSLANIATIGRQLRTANMIALLDHLPDVERAEMLATVQERLAKPE